MSTSEQTMNAARVADFNVSTDAGPPPSSIGELNPQPIPPGVVDVREVARADAGAWKSFSWASLHSGDCTLTNAVLTIMVDGRVTFTAITQTSSGPVIFGGGDAYLLWLTVRDGSRQTIMNLPELVGPSMTVGGRPYPWNASLGPFGVLQTRFNDIQIVDGSQHC